MKKKISITLAAILVMGMAASANAASNKPAKVKMLKPAKTSISITLKWKKAKNAKKYQIYQLKSKYKKIKTTKKRKFKVKNLTPKTVYKFKVRAINGKKKGKFSKVLKVKTPMGKVHSGVTNPAKTNLVEGDTYTFKKGSETIKVTVTSYYKDRERIDIEGKTESGGKYDYIKIDNTTGWGIEEPDYTKHFEEDTGTAVFDGTTSILKIKDSDTAAYWTLDGTEPKIGQADKTGYSKHCRKNILDNWKWEEIAEEYRQLFESYGYNKTNHQIRTKLRGTATKTTEIWKEPHEDPYGARWIKAYCNGKLIFESATIHNK